MKKPVAAGALLFIAITQFLMALRVAESVYPGYSVSGNYISDLGVGVAAPIFNTSIIILGLCVVVAAYLVAEVFQSKLFRLFIALAGFGAAGVGTFPENVPVLHTIMSLITFLFAGIAAVYGVRVFDRLVGFLSAIAGVVSLAALAFFVSGNYLGLGHGGMERLIVYPVLSWGLMLSGYLLSKR
ncbi:MAG: DUF998 domain-containing protein [Candidatus Caldarchaeum sp.]|uniref:DUF998 domain-containing protein n=1 Tax=Caldiarchaeum subterraneum TaxID=311458 RepID=A0A7C5L6Q9_CALS0